ncbi:hypothetical protein PAECIP111893_00714 [Paenibacillus plantiphilus]|uniref:P/Homo B domain-containing protein n=1 Tax=Paenibacillus plantiphilus TaxID=2905650 RepID=A0ABM9BXG4_9BACL|nr:hypothetical protein [Paenibacillus plantiphilus]CAH1195544.1 hypothetical protein PAECIP111893_00714 [Paenibacillus plantiphilus]
MKKRTGISLAMALIVVLLLLSSISLAKEENYKAGSEDAAASERSVNLPSGPQEIQYESGVDSPYNVIFINNANQVGASSFENSFTPSPSNGSKLNIQVKNNNRSGTVMFKVSQGTQDFGYVDVAAGKGLTRTFTMRDGSGMTGDWKVYVTTNDGHVMDISVDAGAIK